MRFIAEINSSNAAFSEDGPSEVARILRDLADRVERGEDTGNLRDINGNTVGDWGLDPEIADTADETDETDDHPAD